MVFTDNKKASAENRTYVGGNLVLREPVEELGLVVGSVAQVSGAGNGQLQHEFQKRISIFHQINNRFLSRKKEKCRGSYDGSKNGHASEHRRIKFIG